MVLLTRKHGYFSTQTSRRGWEKLRNLNLRLYGTARAEPYSDYILSDSKALHILAHRPADTQKNAGPVGDGGPLVIVWAVGIWNKSSVMVASSITSASRGCSLCVQF